ncbi:hypothetical protein Pcal_0688 [Pyrobaculum calidifontis JCM 11548]|uniref:Uncharacterized protein n=1 Tax=Pyrobaculum calidifontis (strain DSM 21063 / JCM 11548 / VA1) TaxID=410359 RepID=A3MTZ7_PYRCJ|nr:hypothetical protein Pcal_0688 [Pyrobaculum calidifontis JCM 11548]
MVPPVLIGILGGLFVGLSLLDVAPPWLGYPLGAAFLSIYVVALVAGLRMARSKRPSPAGLVGKRGVVVEASGGVCPSEGGWCVLARGLCWLWARRRGGGCGRWGCGACR